MRDVSAPVGKGPLGMDAPAPLVRPRDRRGKNGFGMVGCAPTSGRTGCETRLARVDGLTPRRWPVQALGPYASAPSRLRHAPQTYALSGCRQPDVRYFPNSTHGFSTRWYIANENAKHVANATTALTRL